MKGFVNNKQGEKMSKMKVADKAELRGDFYDMIENGLIEKGVAFEPICTGILAIVDEGKMVEIRVIVKDEEKFDLEDARQAYADKTQKAAERAEAQATKAAEKAAKEVAKAEKAAAKAEADAE